MQRIGTPMKTIALLAAACGIALTCGVAQAEDNIVKFAVSEYTTHSKTSGLSGIGVPPGADATTSNATTVIFTYERLVMPNVGVELVVGVPPTIKGNGAGSVAFLGDNILSAKSVSPTLLVNYHFGSAGDTWRPYVGVGVNYTRFIDANSSLATNVSLGDSWGAAGQIGLNYAINNNWGLFGSIAAVQVKSKLVASGPSLLTTTIDFRPIIYSFGVSYAF
jgi:outer membrane protein